MIMSHIVIPAIAFKFQYILSVLHETGLILPRDELRQVNGVAVTGKQPDDIIQLIVRNTSSITAIFYFLSHLLVTL